MVLLGLLAACGGGSGDDSADKVEDERSEGALADTPRSSLEMARDGDEVTSDDVHAASVVNVWQFEHRRMSKRLVHHYDPGSGPDASGASRGSVSLRYSAIDATGHLIRLEWPYDGRPVTYRYDDPSVANLTWTYAGTPMEGAKAGLGNFWAVSLYQTTAPSHFTAMTHRSSDGAFDSNITETTVPVPVPPPPGVPEPATLVLAGLGLPLLALARRRRAG